MLAGIVAVALAILYELIWANWRAHGIPWWYLAYDKWKRRHGLGWLPF